MEKRGKPTPGRKRSAPKQTDGGKGPGGHPIVGIGASAGGLEALEVFFKAMPADAGMAFILVAHLDPTHVSLLPEILQKRTKMKVRQVVDGAVAEPNCVYVIPPNKDLTILHGTLHLMDLVQHRGVNLPIDAFFRSLAQDQGENAVCIILSGTGTDGTLGVKAIKGEVGMVMVQDEESAKYEGMPRSAIATGLVDYMLPPDRMPEQLIKYTRHSTGKTSSRIAPDDGPIPQALQKIFVLLRSRTEHDFSLYKKNTICRRIERRMNVHQIDDIADYVRYMQESDREAEILFKELLIGVTNFFRDPEAFAILEDKILPKLFQGKPDDYSIRVWVPGCASGEEAYSMAIALHDCMERHNRHFHVQIFGTDIDTEAIETARAGLYPESVRADVGPERIGRYYEKEDDGHYRVKKMIREMLVFAPQNVIKDPPFTKLDMLCCRNLLIYLGPELQRKLLPIFHYSLKPEGILFLGSSETIGQNTDLFTQASRKWKIFRRNPSLGGPSPVLNFPTQARSSEAREQLVPETVQRAEELSALELMETILQQSDTPPCAIINDANNVVYIHGRTGRFLEPAEGKASVNIVEMARPGMKRELITAIRQVTTNKQEVIFRGLRVAHGEDLLFLNLTVRPILENSAMRGLMMVVFEETAAPEASEEREPEPIKKNPKKRSIEELEQELQDNRESLQTTIEELETSNEELKSTNEELQSTNEELQSTNEELETSKEELQSLNEESATVNAELQARIDELSKTNDDMKNLLDATEIPTIFLDTDLRIRRFTTRATEIIPLTAADTGRPIKHLASSLKGIDLGEYGQQVLGDLALRECEVESTDDRHYVMRIRPYRTVSNVIDGVVITFEDTTIRKHIELELRKSEQMWKSLAGNSPDHIMLLDMKYRIEFINYTVPDLSLEQVMGKSILDFIPPEYHQVATDCFQESARSGQPGKYETKYITADKEVRYFETRVAQLKGEDEGTGFLAYSTDITARKHSEMALQETEQRCRVLFELAADSIVLIDVESGELMEYNQQAYEHLGYTQAEFKNLKLSDIETAKSARRITDYIEEAVKLGDEVFKTGHRTKGGETREVQVKARIVGIEERSYLLSIWQDAAQVEMER